MPDAIRAAAEGRFLLQGGPLALLLAQQVTVTHGGEEAGMEMVQP